jgi:hypothetical protein
VPAKSFEVEVKRVGKSSARFPVPLDLRVESGRARPPLERRLAGVARRVRAGDPPV